MKIDRRHALAAGLVGAAAFAGDARGRLPEATAEPITTLQGPDDGTVLTEGTNFAVAPSPDGKQLALDVAGAIWLLPVTGGQARRLTDPMLDASQPDWLPDGKHLVFQAYTQGNFQLWMVDVHSGELRQVTTGPFDHREPAVSPDGAAVAFVTDRSGHCRLAILDLNSGARRDWADLPGEASQPAWSADGRQIVCVSDGRRIVAASQGGEARVIATLPRSPSPLDRSVLAGPAFAPDGTGVVYVEVTGTGARLRGELGHDLIAGEDIFPFRPRWLADGSMIYSADGTIRRRAPGAAAATAIAFEARLAVVRNRPRKPRPARLASGQQPVRGIGSPAPSFDGSRIAFRALNALWVMEPGQPPRRILDDGFCVTDPAWSPDGRRLAFASDRGGTFDLWLIDPAGGEPARLTHHAGAAAGPAWSPDGKQIAFIDQTGAVLVCDVPSGETRKVLDPVFMPGKPSWGPGGRTLALAALVPSSPRFREGTNQILLLDLASSKVRYVPLPGGASISTRGDDGPAWSPDGRHFAFSMASRLWLWPVAEDGTPKGDPQLVSDELCDCPRWSGDSNSLTYLSGGKLRRVAPARGKPQTIPVPLHWAQVRQPRPLVIRAGKMWDGQERTARERVDIVVENAIIASVGPAQGDPPGHAADFIDASDMMVMPGLVDSHVHTQMQGYGLGDREGRLWLSLGITAVRSLAGPAYHSIEYREAIASGARVGPRVFTTGEAIDGTRVFYHMMRPTHEASQLARELERADQLSYDVMKCYVRLPAQSQRRVVVQAHARGMPATSHYAYPSLLYGIDGIEHMGATNKLGFARSVSLTGKVYADIETLLARTGAARVPTLFQASALYRDYPQLVADERLRVLLPPWEYRRLSALMRSTDEVAAAAQLKILENNVAHLLRLDRLGGLIVAGTDAPIDLLGASLHMNLRAMVRFGFSPVDALYTATRNAGRMLNERLGEIRRGAHADLAIVAGNPLERIEEAANVRTVVSGGIAHSVPSLLAPFRPADKARLQAAAGEPVPAPFWWHEPHWVDSCRAGCCVGHA